jgi:D-inositol-3-phosphate glycosyltransferase
MPFGPSGPVESSMQIHLLSSHSSAFLAGDQAQARHPAHLPGDLSAALRRRGHQVEVELLGDVLGGRELHSLREGASAGRKLADRLPPTASPTRPQTAPVLHALDSVAWAAALTARSRTDAAVVLRYAERTDQERPKQSPAQTTERRAQRACLRSADAIAATADGDRQAAVRAGVLGERAVVVPDLVGMMAEGSRPGQLSPAQLTPGQVLVSLAGIGPGSGIETTLAALRWIPDRQLVVAGPGGASDLVVLQNLIRTLGLESRVRWLGWLDRPEAIRLIDSAALVICPSPVAGATAAIEAMTRSRAVAAVQSGRAADVVVDGVTGTILPSHNPSLVGLSLRALLKNPFQLEAMGLAGRERAMTMFAPDRMVTAAEQAYRIALGAA